MEIVEASHGNDGKGGVDDGYGDLREIGELIVAGDEDGGDETRGHQHGLADLQGHSRGEQGVEGQKEVAGGGDMHHEMGQEHVTLRGDEGESRLLHVVEHIDEQTEIEVGGGEGQVAHTGGDRDHNGADQPQSRHDAHSHTRVELQAVEEEVILLKEVEQEEGVGKDDRQKEQGLVGVHLHGAAADLDVHDDIVFIGRQPTDHTARSPQKEKPGIGLVLVKQGVNGGKTAEQSGYGEEHDREACVLGEGEIEEVPLGKEQNAQGV